MQFSALGMLKLQGIEALLLRQRGFVFRHCPIESNTNE